MFDFDKVCELHKRIMKNDTSAIDDIETLEEAKEIIKMIVGSPVFCQIPVVHGTHGATSAEEVCERLGLIGRNLNGRNYV